MAPAHPLYHHTGWHMICTGAAISWGWGHLSRDHWVKNPFLIPSFSHSFLIRTLWRSFHCSDFIYILMLAHVKERRAELISVLFCIHWCISIQSIWKRLSQASPCLSLSRLHLSSWRSAANTTSQQSPRSFLTITKWRSWKSGMTLHSPSFPVYFPLLFSLSTSPPSIPSAQSSRGLIKNKFVILLKVELEKAKPK